MSAASGPKALSLIQGETTHGIRCQESNSVLDLTTDSHGISLKCKGQIILRLGSQWLFRAFSVVKENKEFHGRLNEQL
jgi:hypothetical protein